MKVVGFGHHDLSMHDGGLNVYCARSIFCVQVT